MALRRKRDRGRKEALARLGRRLPFVLALAMLAGCGRPAERIDMERLLDQLTDPLLPARLDVPGARLESSFDRSGGQEDFAQGLVEGPEGWVVLADLEGPGYVSRFWMTGPDASYRLRFYFDGEREPRLDMTLGEYCGGRDPFLPPLAGGENLAWYSYLPVPYARRLVIMGEKPSPEHPPYYHINHTGSLKGVRVESLPATLDAQRCARIRAVGDTWGTKPTAAGDWMTQEERVTLPAGGTTELQGPPGPAILRRVAVKLDPGAKLTPGQRERVLREVTIEVEWDDSGGDSIAVPLGAFFGMPWHATAFSSLLFGAEDAFMEQWLPMPYRTCARFRLRNHGNAKVEVQARMLAQPWPHAAASLGYLHAEWRSSGPEVTQAPHVALVAPGAAKLAATHVAVWSEDADWLCLEGDERLSVDGNAAAVAWHGTGLEDYFNGGWYYQSVLARPTHGVTVLAPFRASQYRLHLLDAPAARNGLRMEFERGPFDSMQGQMESLVFFYSPQPRSVAFAARPADLPGSAETLMWDLLGLERLGDLHGARQRLRAVLEEQAEHPDAELLRLRDIGYERHLAGDAAARPLYEAFLKQVRDDRARDQARLMLRFLDDPDGGLLALFSNVPATAYLDGEPIGMGGNPAAYLFFPVRVTPGRHVLALVVRDRAPPAWVQACLLTHTGVVPTDPSWRWTQGDLEPSWLRAGAPDSRWPTIGGPGTRGPPEEPYRHIRPDGMVLMGSRASGIWPRTQAADPNATYTLRTEFEQPALR